MSDDWNLMQNMPMTEPKLVEVNLQAKGAFAPISNSRIGNDDGMNGALTGVPISGRQCGEPFCFGRLIEEASPQSGLRVLPE